MCSLGRRTAATGTRQGYNESTYDDQVFKFDARDASNATFATFTKPAGSPKPRSKAS